MAELIASLNARDEVPVFIRAAMAHLNLAAIHPFRDGNGRMARALQNLRPRARRHLRAAVREHR